MALLADYTAGTVTVSGTTVTGTGTAWQTAQFREGDIFIAAGFWAVVASVDGETAITLEDWAGPALTNAEYRLRYMSDGSRASAQARQLIDLLGGSGNLEALAGLVGEAGKVPVFTGAGTMGLTDLTPAAQAILALAGSSGAKVPVVTAAGAAALRDIVGAVSQSGGVPTGAIIENGSNANGDYVRFADGTQICWAVMEAVYVSGWYTQGTWTFPAAFISPPGGALAHRGRAAPDSSANSRQGFPFFSSSNLSATFGNVGNNSATFVSGDFSFFRLTAIGRWY